MDPDLLRLGLEADAARVAALVLAGRTADADAYVEETGYRDRLAAWHQSGRLPARGALPLPPDG